MKLDERSEKVRSQLDQVSPTFCLAKWLQVELFLQFGFSQSCNYIVEPYRIDPKLVKNDPHLLHNPASKIAARKQLLNGEKPRQCDYCWRVEEKKSAISNRMVTSGSDWALPFFDEVVQAKLGENISPRYLEVSFSNKCNLACSYCFPGFSHRWADELKESGSYPVSGRQHNLEYLTQEKIIPGPEEKNPYLKAFDQWFPEVYPGLKVLRFTGGEPMLHSRVYQVLERIEAEPNPSLSLALNSNLSVPPGVALKMAKILGQLSIDKKVSNVMLYPSLDSWGSHAEYIRYGLNLETFQKNLEVFLEAVPNLHVCFMVTHSALSLFRFTELLEYVESLKSRFGNSQILIDTNFLVEPTYLSVKLLPDHYNRLAEKAQKFLEKACFLDYERNKFEVFFQFMKSRFTGADLILAQSDFLKFWKEHDRRRETDLLKSIPEAKELIEICQKSLIQGFSNSKN